MSHSPVEGYAAWTGLSLSSEAEWVFAARAGGKGTELACGDDLVPGVHHANVWQGQSPYANTWDDGWLRTSAVASYPANGYSLVDMIGNVWESTGDWWSLPRRRESLRWELLRWPEARRRRRGDQRRSCRSPRHLLPRSEGRVKPVRSQLSAAFPPVGPPRTSSRYVHVAYPLSVRAGEAFGNSQRPMARPIASGTTSPTKMLRATMPMGNCAWTS